MPSSWCISEGKHENLYNLKFWSFSDNIEPEPFHRDLPLNLILGDKKCFKGKEGKVLGEVECKSYDIRICVCACMCVHSFPPPHTSRKLLLLENELKIEMVTSNLFMSLFSGVWIFQTSISLYFPLSFQFALIRCLL